MTRCGCTKIIIVDAGLDSFDIPLMTKRHYFVRDEFISSDPKTERRTFVRDVFSDTFSMYSFVEKGE